MHSGTEVIVNEWFCYWYRYCFKILPVNHVVVPVVSYPFLLCIPQIQGEVTGVEALTEDVAGAEVDQVAVEVI